MFRSSLTVWIAVFGSSAVLAAGSSPIPEPVTPPAAEVSPEQRAIEHYNAGLASRDDAWKLERKLESAAAGEQAKLEGKIERAYARAIEEFEEAIAANPRLHQAWSSLGYVKRRSGDTQQALAAYDQALTLKPDYGEALEYRAEAYLQLGRIADAQSSHDELRRLDPKLADELLAAMRSWVERQRVEPGEINVGQLDELERWIDAQGRGELPSTSSLRKARGW